MALSPATQPKPDMATSDSYVLRGGEWLSSPCAVGFVRPPTRQGVAERGRLGYLVQSADARPLADELCASLTHALVQTYYSETSSIDRSLMEALLAANDVLFDHNVRADMAARVLVGIACVVVQDSRLYLARLGPACVWVISEQAMEQFPATSRWHQNGDDLASDMDREPPVGMRPDVEPEIEIRPLSGEVLLVLQSRGLQQRLEPTALLRMLSGQDRAQTCQRLSQVSDGRDLAILAIGYTPAETPAGEPQTGTAVAAGSATVKTAAAVTGDEAVGQSATLVGHTPGISTATPVSPVSREEWTVPQAGVSEPDDRVDAGRGPAMQPASPSLGSGAPEPDAEWDDDDDDAWAEEGDDEFDEGQPAPLGSAGPREHIEFAARAESVARDAGRVLQSGARRLRDGAEDALLKVLPDRLPERPDPEATRMPAISPASQSLVIIALLLPLLVLFTVIMVRVQYDREVGGRRASIRQTAQSEYDQAIGATSPELMADGLERSLELVEAGLAILPEDDVLVDLRIRATLKLDEVNRVERLFHFKRLDSFTIGGTVLNAPSRIVIHEKDALVLNKGAGQVHGYTLSDVGDTVSSRADAQVLLRTGERRGATEVGELVDMAWLAPTGSRTEGALVVLDRGGTLWTWRNNAFEAVPVADSDTWLKPVAMAAFMGNLYVLDPLAGRILKYLPSNNAYTTPPHPYLSSTVTVDMLGAVDMAIDGNIYVLFADGTIHKFFDGEEVPFPMTGLPSGMRNPTSIFVSGPQEPQGEGWVYVSDLGNERIVQFDKQGNYLRSFKANTSEPYMTALGGVFVDETSQRIFIFSERQFALVSLPPLPSR